MAKYNIVLGTAVRSVGDITLYRRDGKQVARVRIREIANPKSEAQSEIRNYVAPVTKFYAPLRQALAKSFEGLNKSKSYDQFLRTNIKLAKNNEWFLDKGTPFYPMPYQLSRGSISPLQCTVERDGDYTTAYINVGTLPLSYIRIGDLSTSLMGLGYHKNDVVTLIAIYQVDDVQFNVSQCQFYINPLDAAAITTLTDNGITWNNNDGHLEAMNNDYQVVACAAIVSRKRGKEWLRSTQFLAVDPAIVSGLVSASRRASSIASYGPQSSEGGGSVYPDPGGEVFNCQTISGRSLLFYGGQYNATTLHNGSAIYLKLKPANLDEYFYVKKSDSQFLGTNSNDSLNPADWRWIAPFGVVPTDAVTILAGDGSSFDDYLTSIGFTP